jgi:hypothetical protein
MADFQAGSFSEFPGLAASATFCFCAISQKNLRQAHHDFDSGAGAGR